MLRAGRVVIPGLVAAAVLLFASSAAAMEIARPNLFTAPWSKQPGGPREGRIKAETRGGQMAGYLIVKEREVEGAAWVGVRLGKKPNDRVGWVPERRIDRIDAKYRIVISLDRRTMALRTDARLIWKARVVIGKPETPTPKGLFALHDFYRVRNDLRPWQIEITAHSEVLKTFMGGPGRVAIHGRHGALRAPLGSRASNGCVRAQNWALRSIRKLAPIGTPVIIE